MYLIPQLYRVSPLKLVSGASFTSDKTESAFYDTDLQLMMKMVTKEKRTHLTLLLLAKIFTLS